MITHVLDTSAILAHYQAEKGGADVDALITSGTGLGVSVVCLIELKTRLDAICTDPMEAQRAYRLYADDVATIVVADRTIVNIAMELRDKSAKRLPTIDSIIAATAKANDAILVHRDPHFAAISPSELKQIQLPEK